MRIRVFIILLTGILAVLPFDIRVLAQPYRDTLPVAPVEIFRQLITAATTNQTEKVQRIIPILKPLLDHIHEKWSVHIENQFLVALSEKDHLKITQTTYDLIYFDLKDLLSLAEDQVNTSPSDSKSKIRAAYLNYLLLSPTIEKENFAIDQRIKSLFRNIVLSLDISSPYSYELAPGTGSQATVDEISRMIAEVDENVRNGLRRSG